MRMSGRDKMVAGVSFAACCAVVLSSALPLLLAAPGVPSAGPGTPSSVTGVPGIALRDQGAPGPPHLPHPAPGSAPALDVWAAPARPAAPPPSRAAARQPVPVPAARRTAPPAAPPAAVTVAIGTGPACAVTVNLLGLGGCAGIGG